ncbi:hypothetical protein NVP1188A_27 [Vibrio phage 1.188.A._10N.286.51.A6]|uniref:Uncharacterized protein n=4 Tax=Mukerjeevirus TaxID=2733146 RepID=A0A2I7REH6_9CAUD|nr:hypothetical protein HOU76_gp06 [Vibrio phage 1.169.O._10N.261.52.B1]YP_009817486.1 hypothetical protein HOU77_gp79 [Vibrio phage 1.188.A._10N.286.51.A6]AUR93681.1 hypothetical protein NVP1188B_27 [Vibrio phage 1.188.B._10N.286.51.A6]AUR93767.1 hypothetical protein NVP1188C_27 [Vibrio phage 1.188.C._10N.286.51.A6]AUR92034.1 hypothetical protein NVP1169O_06 [Vibrio phage 1.169.O._10N.261.52.B1]AUR93595.1 hypothetical protein NVP1188A_27 [Vibrio phage 1.188.A._10N.286.51.A6]
MTTKLTVVTTSDSIEDFFERVPKNMKKHLHPKLEQEIVKQLEADETGDMYRDTLITNTDLMSKYSSNPERYSRAVKFVSCLNLGKKVYEAFALSHPEKYHEYRQEMRNGNLTKSTLTKKLSLKGANFKKTQMVTELMARSMIPLALTYDHYRHEGVQVLADLMHNADSERVQMESADKLLTHLNLDTTEFKTSADVEESTSSAISMLASTLDKMVDIHKEQRASDPKLKNSEVMDAIIVEATKHTK